MPRKCALSKEIDYSASGKVKSKCGPDFIVIQPWDLFRLKNIHSNKPSLVQVFKTLFCIRIAGGNFQTAGHNCL